MTCEKYERLISDNLDRQLSVSERVELQKHLAECDACREFQQSVLADREQLAALPSVEMIPPVVSARKQEESLLTRIWSMRLSVPLPVAAVIALLILGLAALSAFHRTESPQVIEPTPSGSIDYVQVEVVPVSSARPFTPESHINKR